jgi:hypothetical protein
MANDCWNSVVIKGDESTLKKIEEKFNSSENGVFNVNNYQTLFDTDVSDMTEEDFGSKRFIPSVTMDNGQLHISGDSAWSPMTGLFERICVEYGVEAELEYDEMGYDFAGHIIWDSKGVEVLNDEWTYWERLCMKDSDNFWEEMQWRYENYESFDELVADFNLDEWKDKTILDQDRLETEFENYLEENS